MYFSCKVVSRFDSIVNVISTCEGDRKEKNELQIIIKNKLTKKIPFNLNQSENE
jgi:hypothetical protein